MLHVQWEIIEWLKEELWVTDHDVQVDKAISP